MFVPELPYYELIIRSGLVYIVLLVLIRFSGKRTVGQFTPFDLLVMMLLSEAVSEALSGGDASVLGGLMSASTLVFLNFLVGLLTARSKPIERFIQGEVILLGREGKLFDSVLKKHSVGNSDVETALRKADCTLKGTKYIFLEPDGTISVLKKENESEVN